MGGYLKLSTAATVKFGPFLDDGDGKTAETTLTIQKANVRLSKNGGNMAAASADQGVADAGAPHDELGYYDVSVDATDTGTVGRLKIMAHVAGALAVWDEYMVLPAMMYDSIVAGTDRLDVNVTHIGDTAQTANDNGADINAILIDTETTLDGLIKDVPTVAEFEARTLVSAGYATAAALATVDGIVDNILVDTETTIPTTLSTMSGKVDDSLVDTISIEAKLDIVDTVVGKLVAGTVIAAVGVVDNKMRPVGTGPRGLDCTWLAPRF